MMRAPSPSEPKSTFPTYQVPQKLVEESAMRGAPPVQVLGTARGGRANPPFLPPGREQRDPMSVINTGSSCPQGNSNLRTMQSVTENYCLLNSTTTNVATTVTVPNRQRNGRQSDEAAHNNSSKLVSKFGALPLGRDIPKQKSDDLEVLDNQKKKNHANDTTNNDDEATRFAPPLRLRGGGESSLSTGTSSWGSPPSQQATNNNAGGGSSTSGWGSANPANQNAAGTQQWNNNANRPPTSNQGPTTQDQANKVNANGQQPPTSQSNSGGTGWGTKPQTGNNGPAANNPTSTANSQNNNGAATNTTKQQLEQLNNMREAIFSQDGWGGQHVNQDSHWDIPNSPEPMKMDGSSSSSWKPTVNNGTELWEANLRNGGQPPPQPQQKTPWGHTPSTNIGGTWGEDDDTDSSNVWTGVPSGQQQWGGNSNNGAAMWGAGPKKENDWGSGAAVGSSGGGGGNGGGSWGDPRSADGRQTAGGGTASMDMRAGASAPNPQMRPMDPTEHIRQLVAGVGDMRGDPRGITGRINAGGADAFWGQSGHPAAVQHMHHQNKVSGVGGPGNGSGGWEEPSPPTQRRNMPNYDDGTSLWGNPQQGAGSHWKDLPTGAGMGRGSASGPPGMAPSRIKSDPGPVWGHAGAGPTGRNGSWDEVGPGGNGGGGGGWDDGPWPKQKMPGTLWGDNELEWGHKAGPKQQLTKEMIWNSKQFRVLADMGYKKDDVENALRMRDMNVDEAIDLLSPMRDWGSRPHDDYHDHPQFGRPRFPSGPAGQMGFPGAGNGAPNILNNMNSGGAGNNLINSMSPAVVQKLLTQGGGQQGFGGSTPAAGRPLQPQSQPSTQQLRMLVQQIQMAVQAGYLNHQILNQPLAPQTLVLLNQLLNQIKTLQQLAQQQVINGGKPGTPSFLQCSVLITKTKQQITNLQNQIAAQQAIYVKQQQHQSLGGGGGDLFKSGGGMHDSLNAMQSNFAELAIKESQVVSMGGGELRDRLMTGAELLQTQQQQSRLNQWINKDKEDGGEFSRAPGSASKPLATSPNLNPLLPQSDGPWSTGRSGDTGWPDSSGGDSSNDVKDAQWSSGAQPSLTDLVPEFEPGKPWKGNQIKSIEDDPSITPGSVVRSPLSIPTIKDPDMFMNPSKSPPAGDTIPTGLSSSTWSFNPPTSTAFTTPQSKSKVDLNPSTAVTSELWGAPKSRGPPPGLSAKGASLANGWSSSGNLVSGSVPWGGGAGQRSSGSWGSSSPWLLLRNLTAQIDGSTLRTLCMQHGPLQSFHLYLHQGFALAKYSTRDEATKAQTALNNCVLGNTTILAENPTDWDANTLLNQVANQPGSSGGWRGSSKQVPGSGGDTWSTGGWPNNPSTSLWANTPLDSGDQSRATPSSLNSFLPNDLLGGESM